MGLAAFLWFARPISCLTLNWSRRLHHVWSFAGRSRTVDRAWLGRPAARIGSAMSTQANVESHAVFAALVARATKPVIRIFAASNRAPVGELAAAH